MKRGASIAVLSIIALAVLLAVPASVSAARVPGLVILLDLSHDQNAGGVEEIMKIVPEAHWVILVKSEEDVDNLPSFVKNFASEIRVGGFTPDNLKEVDMVVVGQPQTLLSEDEVKAIAEWFNSTQKAIWLAGDSDYPAQGSELSQEFANIVLEAIGSHLRLDYVSVEDPVMCAEKPYRVVGIVDPPKELAVLGYAAEKVLFHGPGAVAAVLPDGTWVNPLTNPIENVYVVVRTTENGRIVESQPPSPGAPGHLGIAYTVGMTGMFPLLAVEVMPNGNKVIVSGETPYSGYQAGVTWTYYGQLLDGMRFFRNIVLWATGYMGELKEYQKYLSTVGILDKKVSELAAAVGGIQTSVSDLSGKYSSLSDEVAGLEDKLNAVIGDVDKLSSNLKDLDGKVTSKLSGLSDDVSKLKSDVSSLSSKVSELESTLSNVSASVNTPLYVAVVAIILSLIAIALSFMKRK
ncbi:MAG: hypothetical protein J7J20_03215 [Desulfurococcales archaeon]|nr:hypothetical protein [Desulfurococcales archaeon]